MPSDESGKSDGRETHIDDELGLFIPKDLREFDSQIVFRTPRATIQHFGTQPLDGYYGMIHADEFGDPGEMCDPKNPELAPDRVKIKPQGEDPVTLTVEIDPEIRTDGGGVTAEASSIVFDRWIGKAGENIDKWGLQDEETLLLAIQEELGELTQAVLEARAEDGDPGRIDEELDDLGALLLQFHDRRRRRSLSTGSDRSGGDSDA